MERKTECGQKKLERKVGVRPLGSWVRVARRETQRRDNRIEEKDDKCLFHSAYMCILYLYCSQTVMCVKS